MKTRRKKINHRPRTVYGSQSRPYVAEQGDGVKTKGVRNDGKGQGDKDAKPIFVNRAYTGVNKGKVYPYASAKRGGTSAAPQG